MKRVCIYPKDLQLLTGKSYRQCVRMLQAVREYYQKPKKSLVSIKEWCDYHGLDEEDISKYINH